MDRDPTRAKGSATATITQRIEPACEQAYEALLVGIHEAAKAFGGFLRREVIKSHAGSYLEYTHVIHFDNETNLRRWEHSPERHEWLSRMATMAIHSTPLQMITGLETWFTLSPGKPIVPPPRYKMAIVTWLAIFPLITLISYATGPFFGHLPIVVRTLVVTAAVVPLMTYVVMPRMTRLFGRWLYPAERRDS
jgi:antibiotic biosynthesis monooxygenase (ABM) superfamily enzyme